MIPTTGTVEIAGAQYTWRSPKLKHLIEVEQLVGPITALTTVNSVRGRAYLAHAILRDDQPNLTPGIILDWPASAFSEMWELIRLAIPIYGGGAGEVGQPVPPASPAAEAGNPPGQTDSPSSSSSPSSEGPAGIPNAPDGSG